MFGRMPLAGLLLLVTLAPPASAAAAPAIDDTVRVEGAGTSLFLELRGPRAASPILLFLHGGPGDPLGLIAFRAYVGPALEAEALVAYLDQRGVLRSAPVPDSAQTIAHHVNDVLYVVDALATRFPGRPIFLVGHSWGGLLAVLVALQRPAHLAGIVDAAGPFDMPSALRADYEATLAWARSAGRSDAVDSLEAIGPPPYARLDAQLVLSRWASAGNDGIDAHVEPARLFARPPYTTFDPAWVESQTRIPRAMLGELSRVRCMDRVADARLPLLVLVGRRDLFAPPSALRPGYEAWGGPKSWVELKDAHHLLFVDEPAAFATAVLDFVKRYAPGAGAR